MSKKLWGYTDDTSGDIEEFVAAELSDIPSPPQYTYTNSTGSTINKGSLVNIFNASGTPKIQLADSSSTNLPVRGVVSANIANSATGNVLFAGTLNGYSFVAADIGKRVYSDPSTPGGVTLTATNTAGQYRQEIGWVADAGVININIHEPVKQV